MKKCGYACMNRRDFLAWSGGVATAAASFPTFPGEFAHAEERSQHATLEANASLPNFPEPENAKLQLRLQGKELEDHAEFLGLPLVHVYSGRRYPF